jgi:N-acetylglucosamine kinase
MISAFDIGGSKILSGLYEDSGKQVSSNETKTPIVDYDAFLEAIKNDVAPQSQAIGISIAGVLDATRRKVHASNLPCLKDQNLADDLAQLTGKPVHLINDANAFGLAEAVHGAGRDHDVVFGIILGTGLGGAFIVNGKVHVGRNGTAGEWGHGRAVLDASVFPDLSLQCGCGQENCLDLFGGARGLEFIHQHLSGNQQSSVEIVTHWQAGEPAATKSIHEYLNILSVSLAQVLNILDPSIVIVGGGLSKAPALIDALHKRVCELTLARTGTPDFQLAQCGPDAGLLGAMLHAATMIKGTR